MKRFEYFQTADPGVYRSRNPILKNIRLILLNELSEAPYNAPVKCFASQKSEQRKAFRTIDQTLKKSLPVGVEWFIYGLKKILLFAKGDAMYEVDELTPETVMKVGKESIAQILAALPPEEKLKGLTLKDKLTGVSLEELQKYIDSTRREH